MKDTSPDKSSSMKSRSQAATNNKSLKSVRSLKAFKNAKLSGVRGVKDIKEAFAMNYDSDDFAVKLAGVSNKSTFYRTSDALGEQRLKNVDSDNENSRPTSTGKDFFHKRRNKEKSIQKRNFSKESKDNASKQSKGSKGSKKKIKLRFKKMTDSQVESTMSPMPKLGMLSINSVKEIGMRSEFLHPKKYESSEYGIVSQKNNKNNKVKNYSNIRSQKVETLSSEGSSVMSNRGLSNQSAARQKRNYDDDEKKKIKKFIGQQVEKRKAEETIKVEKKIIDVKKKVEIQENLKNLFHKTKKIVENNSRIKKRKDPTPEKVIETVQIKRIIAPKEVKLKFTASQPNFNSPEPDKAKARAHILNILKKQKEKVLKTASKSRLTNTNPNISKKKGKKYCTSEKDHWKDKSKDKSKDKDKSKENSTDRSKTKKKKILNKKVSNIHDVNMNPASKKRKKLSGNSSQGTTSKVAKQNVLNRKKLIQGSTEDHVNFRSILNKKIKNINN